MLQRYTFVVFLYNTKLANMIIYHKLHDFRQFMLMGDVSKELTKLRPIQGTYEVWSDKVIMNYVFKHRNFD